MILLGSYLDVEQCALGLNLIGIAYIVGALAWTYLR
jgi:hypothetical protein